MLSPKAKRNILRILPFPMMWFIFGSVYAVVEKGILGDLGHYPSTGNPYDFSSSIYIVPMSAFVAGLFIGSCEILYLNKWFIHQTFASKIVFKSMIYLVLIISFLIITTGIGHSSSLQTSIFDKRVLDYISAFLFDYAFLSVSIYMATTIIVTQFYAEVSDNIGYGVLSNFLRGKYHTPKEEERIFMFLDMRASSTIAEELGHVKYFEMLREFYSDMSESIIVHGGEIYQYVGDEVVVSWRFMRGSKDDLCIQCFFAIKAEIEKQASKYRERFGLVPGFKAGFHLGKVTTGEIGVIKKEIIFTGDVLNTASRIQALCNVHKVDIILSGDLMNKLDLQPNFQIIPLGENELRGKGKKVELFSIVQS